MSIDDTAEKTSMAAAPPLQIGAPVYARDVRYGTLERVAVDPHARLVTHLVVGQGWLL